MSLKDKHLNTAMKMYSLGNPLEEIAKACEVSISTLTKWKNECRGTTLDWDNKLNVENKERINPEEWFNSSLVLLLKWVGDNPEEWTEDKLKMLNDFLAAKKKYDGDRDILTETTRVIKDLARFVKEHYPNKTEEFGEMLSQFMHAQQEV